MEQIQLPKIGLGTWLLTSKQAEKVVRKALKIGYKLIDTAQIYKNEEGIGNAIKDSGISREELIIATKIWVTNLSPRKIRKSTMECLKKLKTDYIDILYIHWPACFYKPKKTFKVLDQLVSDGIVKYIGLSNFNRKLTLEALQISESPIICNQIEIHPYLPQFEMVEFIREKGLHPVAYAPLARGKVLKDPIILNIANKNGITPAQVVLAWHISRGIIPIPKSSKEQRIEENFHAIEITLDKEDLGLIDRIKKRERLFNPPFLAPRWEQ